MPSSTATSSSSTARPWWRPSPREHDVLGSVDDFILNVLVTIHKPFFVIGRSMAYVVGLLVFRLYCLVSAFRKGRRQPTHTTAGCSTAVPESTTNVYNNATTSKDNRKKPPPSASTNNSDSSQSPTTQRTWRWNRPSQAIPDTSFVRPFPTSVSNGTAPVPLPQATTVAEPPLPTTANDKVKEKQQQEEEGVDPLQATPAKKRKRKSSQDKDDKKKKKRRNKKKKKKNKRKKKSKKRKADNESDSDSDSTFDREYRISIQKSAKRYKQLQLSEDKSSNSDSSEEQLLDDDQEPENDDNENDSDDDSSVESESNNKVSEKSGNNASISVNLPKEARDLPPSYCEHFQQVGFCSWSGKMLPCMIVSPFDFIEGSSFRNTWMTVARRHLKRHASLEDGRMEVMVYWFTDNTYSMVDPSKFVAWDKANPQWKQPSTKILQKINEGIALTDKETVHHEGLQSAEAEAKKLPSLRSHPQLEWLELQEKRRGQKRAKKKKK